MATVTKRKASEPKWNKSEGFELVRKISLDKILPDPGQVRRHFDPVDIAELAESLKTIKQQQPIKVYEDGKLFIILIGERRYRAAIVAELPTLDCIVVPKPSKNQRQLIQLTENIQRAEMDAIETANAFSEALTLNGWTSKQLAEELGIKPERVSKSIALTKLSLDVQDLVRKGKLPAASAYHLSRLGSYAEQKELAAAAIDQDLTRDQVAAEVQNLIAMKVLPDQTNFIEQAPPQTPIELEKKRFPKSEMMTPKPETIEPKPETDKAKNTVALAPSTVFGWREPRKHETFSEWNYEVPGRPGTFAQIRMNGSGRGWKDVFAMLEMMSDAVVALSRFADIQADRQPLPGDIVEIFDDGKFGLHIIGQRGKLVYEEGSSCWVSWIDRAVMNKYEGVILPDMVRLVTEGGEA
jgi:ParB/RepB/Spo0J family partition protein